jgi:hypothetical protein
LVIDVTEINTGEGHEGSPNARLNTLSLFLGDVVGITWKDFAPFPCDLRSNVYLLCFKPRVRIYGCPRLAR